MSAAIWLGRALFALVWGAMLANLVWPFPGKGYALFLILLLILVAVHLLQLLMFRTVYATQLQWRRGDSWHIVIFGIVGWMTILHAQPQRQPRASNN